MMNSSSTPNASQPIPWALLGIPDHQGVLAVGGRLGAVAGPSAIRKVLQRFSGENELKSLMTDHGDVGPL